MLMANAVRVSFATFDMTQEKNIYIPVASEALGKLWKQRFDFGGIMKNHEE